MSVKPNFMQSYLIMAAFGVGIYSGYHMSNELEVSGDSIQTCFTPGQPCTKMIVSKIDAAEKRILVQAFAFTSKPILNALLRAHRRGVRVSIILDKSNLAFKKYNPLDEIEEIKDIKIDIVSGIAHNKVMIIDDKVITGSFNFSQAAEHRNVENVVIISNKDITSRFLQNWKNRYNKSRSMLELKSENNNGKFAAKTRTKPEQSRAFG